MKINELFDKEYISIDEVSINVTAQREKIDEWSRTHEQSEAFKHLKRQGIEITPACPLHILFDLDKLSFFTFDELSDKVLSGELISISPYDTVDNVYLKINSVLSKKNNSVAVDQLMSKLREDDFSGLVAAKTLAVITKENKLSLVDQNEYWDNYSEDSPHILASGGASVGVPVFLNGERPILHSLIIEFTNNGYRELTPKESSELFDEVNDKRLANLRTYSGTQLITSDLDEEQMSEYISLVNRVVDEAYVPTKEEKERLTVSTIGSNYDWIDTINEDKKYLYEVIASDPNKLKPLYEQFTSTCPEVDLVEDEGVFSVSYDKISGFTFNEISPDSLDWLFGNAINIKNPREIADYLVRI